MIAAIQLSIVGYDYWQILSITVISVVFEMIAFLSLIRGVLIFLSAESDRRQNGLLFSNSILNSQTDESFKRYRKYNIRVLQTHESGPSLPYIFITGMAISLFVLQFVLAPYVDFNLEEIQLLFGQISPILPSTITLLGALMLGNGIIGISFNLFSKFMVEKWTEMPKEGILTEAQKLKSTKYMKSDMTYEDIIALLTDAELGDPHAIETTMTAAKQIDRDIEKFKRTRWLFVLVIAIISIIDFIIFLMFM
jgi:hypothetical protein